MMKCNPRWLFRGPRFGQILRVLVLEQSSEQLLRDTLQNGVSHRCACVKQSTKRGGIAPFWGRAGLP